MSAATETERPFLGIDPATAHLEPAELDRLIAMVKTPRCDATFSLVERFAAVDRLLAHVMAGEPGDG